MFYIIYRVTDHLTEQIELKADQEYVLDGLHDAVMDTDT